MSVKSVISILVATSLLISCSQEQASNEQIAREMVRKGDFEQSIVYLKLWITEQPNNTKARILLGKALKESGNPEAALKEFYKAHELDGSFDEYGVSLLELLAIKGAFEEILLLVEDVKSENLELARALKFYEAYSLFEIQQDYKANLLLATISKAFDSPYYQISQALNYWAFEDYENTVRMATNALRLAPSMYLAREFRANALLKLNRYENALQDLAVLTESPVKSVKVDIQQAQALIQLGRYREAAVLVDSSLKLFPNAVVTNRLKATLEFLDKKVSSAKQYSEKALSSSRNSDAASLLIASASNLLLNNSELAFDQAKRLEGYVKSPAAVELSDIANRKVENDILSSIGENERAYIRELVLDAMGLLRGVESISEKGIEIVKEISFEKDFLFEKKLTENKSADALDFLFKKDEIFIDNQSLESIKLLLEKKKYDEALLLSNKTIRKESSLLELQTHLVLLVLNDKFDEAVTLGSELLSHGDTSASTLISFAKASLKVGNIDEALNTIDRAVEHHPDSIRVLNTLFDFPIKQVRSRLPAFQLAYERNQNDVDYAFLLAKFYAAEKNAAEVIRLLAPHKPNVDKNFNEFWLLLTDSFLLAGEHHRALETAIFWMQLDFSNNVAFNKLLNLAELYQDYRAALGLIEMKIADKGVSDFLRLLKSGYLLQLNQSGSALVELNHVSEEIKASSQWKGLMSRALYLNGKTDKALTLAKESYNERPSSWNTSTILGVHISQNDTEEFERFAEEHIIKYPNDIKTLEALFSYYYPSKLKKALSVAQQVLLLSDDINWKNNTAWLLLELNSSEEALEYFDDLVSSPNHNHNDTAARIAIELGRAKDVLRQTQERVEREPNPFYQLTLAEIYRDLNMTSEAIKVIQNISPVESTDFIIRYKRLIAN